MRLTKNARRLLYGSFLILLGISHFINIGSLGAILAVVAIVLGVVTLLGVI